MVIVRNGLACDARAVVERDYNSLLIRLVAHVGPLHLIGYNGRL